MGGAWGMLSNHATSHADGISQINRRNRAFDEFWHFRVSRSARADFAVPAFRSPQSTAAAAGVIILV